MPEKASVSFAELIKLTDPNGSPVWISTAGIRRIKQDANGLSIIEMGPQWSQTVQENVATVIAPIQSE